MKDLTKEQKKLHELGLDDLSKGTFGVLMEPKEVDRLSHLRADKKPFIGNEEEEEEED